MSIIKSFPLICALGFAGSSLSIGGAQAINGITRYPQRVAQAMPDNDRSPASGTGDRILRSRDLTVDDVSRNPPVRGSIYNGGSSDDDNSRNPSQAVPNRGGETGGPAAR